MSYTAASFSHLAHPNWKRHTHLKSLGKMGRRITAALESSRRALYTSETNLSSLLQSWQHIQSCLPGFLLLSISASGWAVQRPVLLTHLLRNHKASQGSESPHQRKLERKRKVTEFDIFFDSFPYFLWLQWTCRFVSYFFFALWQLPSPQFLPFSTLLPVKLTSFRWSPWYQLSQLWSNLFFIAK